MQVRNLKYNSLGTIDCEIEHPTYGWIPFTASPRDVESTGRDIYNAAIQGTYGVVTEYVTPTVVPTIPSVVTMRQARLALLQQNLLQQVQFSIDSLPSPQKEAAQIEWDYSSEVHRDKPFVQLLGAALGLTKEQLDNLFTLASTL